MIGRSFLIAFTAAALGWSGCSGGPSVATEPLRCPAVVQAKVSPEKPTVMVSYTEPSVNLAGGPLGGLAKTTIYYDLGAGRVPAKEVPATAATGGGRISETITVPLSQPAETAVRICVTATDLHGNESAMTR
jgi:hypothetical protein